MGRAANKPVAHQRRQWRTNLRPDASVAVQTADQSLDPFGFFPTFISRIEGLGGSERGFDPFFVFHTPYIAAPVGRWRFTVRFENLRARAGTLVLRVHILSNTPGAVAQLANSERQPLPKLAANGSSLTIDFLGMENVTFALMGQVPDHTDAAAVGMLVSVSRLDDHLQTHHSAETENTPFRSEAVVTNPLIVSSKEPTFADPVSQPCTAQQLAEPAFRSWWRRLGRQQAANARDWCDVFALQALDRYGVLRSGARGLANDGHGYAILLSDIDVELQGVRFAELEGDRGASADFVVNIDEAGEIGRPQMSANMLSLLQLVRPGGMVVQCFPYTHENPERRKDESSALDRADIERVALAIIGRGHDLAQIRPSLSDAAKGKPNTMFGLIARRARVTA